MWFSSNSVLVSSCLFSAKEVPVCRSACLPAFQSAFISVYIYSCRSVYMCVCLCFDLSAMCVYVHKSVWLLLPTPDLMADSFLSMQPVNKTLNTLWWLFVYLCKFASFPICLPVCLPLCLSDYLSVWDIKYNFLRDIKQSKPKLKL